MNDKEQKQYLCSLTIDGGERTQDSIKASTSSDAVSNTGNDFIDEVFTENLTDLLGQTNGDIPSPSMSDQHSDSSDAATEWMEATLGRSHRFWSFRSLLTFDAIQGSFINQLPTPLPHYATICHKFGFNVAFLDMKHGGRHMGPALLEPYRHVGDPVIDSIMNDLETCGRPLKAGDDLFAAAQDKALPAAILADLEAFFEYYKQTPPWLDLKQLERGQRVFLKYCPAISVSLYYRSLVAGFSIPKISKVIQATAYLAPPSRPGDVTLRLIDTGGLLGACFAEELNPGGDGWKTALHVRFLHAKVRRVLLKRGGKRAWDTATNGIPINQEDMAATLLAFSINSLVGMEYISGISISNEERCDFLAVWRYIGWLLGVYCENDSWSTLLRPLDPCGPGWYPFYPDPIAHAKAILESVVFHILEPDESSAVIAHHLLNIGRPKRDVNGRTIFDNDKTTMTSSMAEKQQVPFLFRALVCRHFIGDPLADALKLPFHFSWTQRLKLSLYSFLYLWCLRVYTWVTMIYPQPFISWHKRVLHRFHKDWTTLHSSRMARTLNTASACPFAMVRDPNDN